MTSGTTGSLAIQSNRVLRVNAWVGSSLLNVSRGMVESKDELYVHSIPYIQFPLLPNGLPFTGECVVVLGLTVSHRVEKGIWECLDRHMTSSAPGNSLVVLQECQSG
jgi:hypothetical protein